MQGNLKISLVHNCTMNLFRTYQVVSFLMFMSVVCKRIKLKKFRLIVILMFIKR